MRPQSVFMSCKILLAFGDGKRPLRVLDTEVEAEDFGRLEVVVD